MILYILSILTLCFVGCAHFPALGTEYACRWRSSFTVSSKFKLERIMVFFLMVCLLAACGNKEKRREIETYVATIEARKIKEIEPLPDIKPYEPFTYTAYSLRSPFVGAFAQETTRKMAAENGIHPDVNRRKEVLESFPLDSLRMVGTLEKNNKKWALVTDPKGAVYRLTTGNYVGQNHGQLNSILDDKLLITEIIPDPSGGWRERKASLALTTEHDKQDAKK